MKVLFYTILLSVLIFNTGCNKDKKFSEIKVGMTYDEVEKILEKPISITRGANELNSDLDDVPIETLKKLIIESTEGEIDSARWLLPQKVKTVGNLIYVTWVYNESKKDTFYVLRNTFKKVKDTVITKVPVYYLGNRKVSKSEFDKSDGYEYRLHDNRVVDKSVYEPYYVSGVYKLPPPKKINKRIEYKINTNLISKKVKDSTEKEYYVVDSKYCVIFDASSGRVTNIGYFPFNVTQITQGI
ncbi:MAG: hypothetical protein KDC74_00750 [Flavobacteriaceae bacterium]|nr:hypothetical protein [Flavobacteriaceae bacterium]